MKLNQSINQSVYDATKERERHCARWLKSLHRTVRRPLALSVLAGSAHGALIIVQSALLALILQRFIIEQSPWQGLTVELAWLALVMLLRSVCSYFTQVCGFSAAVQVKRQIRQEILTRLGELGPAFVKRQHSGQLAANTLEQCEAVEKYFSRYVPQKTIAAIVPVLILLAIFLVNWVVGVIFLVTGPLVPLFMALIGMGAAAASRNQFQEMAWMGGYFLDRLQGLTTLKLFGQADNELQRIGRVADSFKTKTMAVLRIAFLSSAVLEFFSAVAVALVAVYVGLGLLGLIHFGPASDISLQQALFALLLAPEFFQPLRQLAANYHDRAAALGAADHILQVLDRNAGGQEVPNYRESAYCLELIGASKYYGRRLVLSPIDLRVACGEKVALVGETGAGKSTLLNLLLGFEQPSAGQVLINGGRATREHAARQISWLGQRSAIFHGSIADNIRLFDPEIAWQAVESAARAAGVMEFASTLPQGLGTLIGEQGYGLSGGQVQRIALARALLKNAPIVLLDEPTANLDRATKLRLLDSIERLFKDKTVIIASHDSEVVTRMDKRLCLQDGVLL
ncbi:thiol reductant ABC exporter subunit CydD [Methylomarinum vadi]|uniref:thiol reductant ABC exporter subunit CydD n=1 Tax=Methylomarinum vadi TaxID=438855 RepID=UPI00069078DA|nr:thiol reductant ABC exporter subunit CydD [Methylomarinum vadi]